jgi:hypothetical protein
MRTIRCHTMTFSFPGFKDCEEELHARGAWFKHPLRISVRLSPPSIRVHDPIVELDETRATRAAVLSVLAKYGGLELQSGITTQQA